MEWNEQLVQKKMQMARLTGPRAMTDKINRSLANEISQIADQYLFEKQNRMIKTQFRPLSGREILGALQTA